MGSLGFCQGLEPIGNFLEAFLSGDFRHAWVHIRVFVGLACNGRFEVVSRTSDREVGSRIATLLQIFKMTVGMPRFSFRCGSKYGSHVVLALDVCLSCKIQIPTVGL